jgi:hypothetical protein
VGPIFDGSTPQPQRTALNLAQELAREGSRADLVSFVPAPVPGVGVWAASDLKRLEAAFTKGSPVAPTVVLEAAPVPTNGDAASLGAQASAYAAAVQSASCAPNVNAVLFDRLVDGAAPAPPTGVYDVNGAPKPSAAAVKGAIQAVARGAVVCPGRQSRVTPTLTFPGQLSPSAPVSVVLGCDRDCLYLIALDRADGQPLVALRGALTGGDPPETITLPKRTLLPGGYRVDVRLVSRVGPGAITRQRSALLTVG